MTIDERLERLVDRHEALAQTVEILTHDVRGLQDIATKQLATAERDGENIRALARIAEIHERRLTTPEGGERQ